MLTQHRFIALRRSKASSQNIGKMCFVNLSKEYYYAAKAYFLHVCKHLQCHHRCSRTSTNLSPINYTMGATTYHSPTLYQTISLQRLSLPTQGYCSTRGDMMYCMTNKKLLTLCITVLMKHQGANPLRTMRHAHCYTCNNIVCVKYVHVHATHTYT